MASRKFLEQVADFYLSPASRHRIEDIIFVFPNRRSGRFLKRYMQQRISGTSFMPRFATIGALVSRFAAVPEAPRRDCIFELYDVYRDVLASRQGAGKPRDFDRFMFWGEIILSDFDDIDRNCVNARELYTNLSRLHEISADYLEEEQKQVVREIWGDSAAPASVGSFWRHIGDDSSDMTARFLSLWDLLADMYAEFRKRLRGRGLATAGMQHREALDRLRTEGRAIIADNRYVFVGFSAPSVSETLIFDKLKDLGAAEFIWDTASPFILDSEGKISRDNASFAILDRLVRRFPMPDGFKLDAITEKPSIDIIGIPSRTAQAKVACEKLSEWLAAGYIDPADPIGTAVILPDESLLMAMLHSLPQELKAINITMGVPFADTSFAALLRSVVTMQMRARLIRGQWRFFHEDILEVLSHPHMRTIAPSECTQVRRHILDNNLYTMAASDLCAMIPALAFVFGTVDDTYRIEGVSGYLMALLDGLRALLAAKSGSDASWETSILSHLRKEIGDIAAQVAAHGIEAGEKSYFALFERALRAHTITMAGTPLKGLQIMSMAETRGLDFDNLIMLSMNDRVFPRRSASKTMIPNNLRTGYGLPPTDREETESSYYFYRLLGRAKRVALMYDSRDASSGDGEASRYITQLRYMHPDAHLRSCSVEVGANPPEKRVLRVGKTPHVLDALNRFRAGGDRFLSASALKTFKHCPLKFFLQYVCGLRDELEVTDYMTSAVYGTILHAAAQCIYDDYKGIPITGAILHGLANDVSARYTPLIERIISKEYYHREALDKDVELPAEGQIVRDLIIDFLSAMFRHESNAWCPTASDSYRYSEGEMLIKGPWRINDSLTVNFKMYIDRVDATADGLRFIDYKTGGDLTEASDIGQLFRHDDSRTDAILQILAYCEAYAALQNTDVAIQPVLYTFRTMDSNGGIQPIRIGGEAVADYHSVSAEFLPALHSLIGDIFSPDTAFVQAAEGSMTCSYCIFAPMCGRVSRDD
ncbi:MAG: PD-(D/E)XK nuclease family protein [Muribaculaceae bacterium]|nr:PD-(D/E)XK nuclease family protein [Muribaculaceae bacterium]